MDSASRLGDVCDMEVERRVASALGGGGGAVDAYKDDSLDTIRRREAELVGDTII